LLPNGEQIYNKRVDLVHINQQHHRCCTTLYPGLVRFNRPPVKQGQKIFFQFSCPRESILEMNLPNKCFHLPNKFSPNPKLSIIFNLLNFTWYEMLIQWSPMLLYWITCSHFHSHYINKISNYQDCIASKLQQIQLLISDTI